MATVAHGTMFTNEGIHLIFKIHSPAINASPISPCIIMLTVQSRSFILTMKPSYSGLTLENPLMVNAIRSDTFIFLHVIRLR
jgi:hypothetical protein